MQRSRRCNSAVEIGRCLPPRALGAFSQQIPSRPREHGHMGELTRVLVVDDERSITDLVAMALKYEGFSVQTAATSRDARRAVMAFRPALIVLDIGLSGATTTSPSPSASRSGWRASGSCCAGTRTAAPAHHG